MATRAQDLYSPMPVMKPQSLLPSLVGTPDQPMPPQPGDGQFEIGGLDPNARTTNAAPAGGIGPTPSSVTPIRPRRAQVPSAAAPVQSLMAPAPAPSMAPQVPAQTMAAPAPQLQQQAPAPVDIVQRGLAKHRRLMAGEAVTAGSVGPAAPRGGARGVYRGSPR